MSYKSKSIKEEHALVSPTPFSSSDNKDSMPSSSITDTTVSAAFFAKLWISCILNHWKWQNECENYRNECTS